MEKHRIITNGALISRSNWREGVYQLSSITNNSEDKEVLDGLIIEGYETKFADETNTNGERFAQGCLDKFIREYYNERLDAAEVYTRNADVRARREAMDAPTVKDSDMYADLVKLVGGKKIAPLTEEERKEM